MVLTVFYFLIQGAGTQVYSLGGNLSFIYKQIASVYISPSTKGRKRESNLAQVYKLRQQVYTLGSREHLQLFISISVVVQSV